MFNDNKLDVAVTCDVTGTTCIHHIFMYIYIRWNADGCGPPN